MPRHRRRCRCRNSRRLQGALLLVCCIPSGDRTNRRCTHCRRRTPAAARRRTSRRRRCRSVVQALSSLHGSALFAWTHPVAGLHESFVHTLPSPQSMTTPCSFPPRTYHRPCRRCRRCTDRCCCCGRTPSWDARIVRARARVGAVPCGARRTSRPSRCRRSCTRSSRCRGRVVRVGAAGGGIARVVRADVPVVAVRRRPADADSAEQASLSVQALPSSQGAVLKLCVQPVAGLHPSSCRRRRRCSRGRRRPGTSRQRTYRRSSRRCRRRTGCCCSRACSPSRDCTRRPCSRWNRRN
jgi:hypothetical protein